MPLGPKGRAAGVTPPPFIIFSPTTNLGGWDITVIGALHTIIALLHSSSYQTTTH